MARMTKPVRTADAAEGTGETGSAASRSFAARHGRSIAMGLPLLAIVLAGGWIYWDHVSRFQSTDDAFIAARQFSLEPKVLGYLTEVPVTDNQHVDAGAVIARIDDRDYRIALAEAEAEAEGATAGIQSIDAQIDVQNAQIAVDEAQVEQARTALEFAREQADRYATLARDGTGSVQNEQQYVAGQNEAEAALKSAQATLALAQRQVETLRAERAGAVANLGQANSARDKAALDLSYTTVSAPQPGRIVQLGGAVGSFVQAGTSLAILVPDDIWVTANFKETQLDGIRPGQAVSLTIDAYPARRFEGRVDSVQPGSGTAFSLLPAENATGNFVKIVQRVPVKVVIDNLPQDVALGPGMSVEPRVRIDPAPSVYERLRGQQ